MSDEYIAFDYEMMLKVRNAFILATASLVIYLYIDKGSFDLLIVHKTISSFVVISDCSGEVGLLIKTKALIIKERPQCKAFARNLQLLLYSTTFLSLLHRVREFNLVS